MTAATKNKMFDTFFKVIWGTIAFLVLTPFQLTAQFYDSDHEVRFYVYDEMIKDPGCNYTTLVFNFNGEKAAVTDSHSAIYAKILEDDNFYEKRIYGPNKKILNYYRYFSTPNKTVYGFPSQYTSNIDKYIFTDNGNQLEIALAGNQEGYSMNRKYIRVSKEKLIELILAFINKQSGSWR